MARSSSSGPTQSVPATRRQRGLTVSQRSVTPHKPRYGTATLSYWLSMGWWRCRHHSRNGATIGAPCGRLPTSMSISSATLGLRVKRHSWAVKVTTVHLPNSMRFDGIRHEYAETKSVPSQALGHCKAFRPSSANCPPPCARGRTQIALAMSSPMRILVIEDESKLAAHICDGLRGAGFCPDHAPALADAQILV